ncbi:MAG: indole-3-glycerol phosphate synthase TrpC [Candidatus Omnitrophica bacterium]|nr:indole-3-glycerol phosphate synthase TrpC [Candidatus Omnitrophota bacterium]
MKTILKKIIEVKKFEIRKSKSILSLAELKKKVSKEKIVTRDFKSALEKKNSLTCIGELKIASPSKGFLNKNLNLVKTAKIYEKEGISAISVLTDSHFKGKLGDLQLVKNEVTIPVLRKDFIIEDYQVYESLYNGADALLLIAAVLSKKSLARLLDLTHKLKMNAIIEIHDLYDLKKIDFRSARIIGINNRNLNDFSLDLENTKKLCGKIPDKMTKISESGINSRADMLYLQKLKIDSVLIGEGLVSASNIPLKIRELLGKRNAKS